MKREKPKSGTNWISDSPSTIRRTVTQTTTSRQQFPLMTLSFTTGKNLFSFACPWIFLWIYWFFHLLLHVGIGKFNKSNSRKILSRFHGKLLSKTIKYVRMKRKTKKPPHDYFIDLTLKVCSIFRIYFTNFSSSTGFMK